MLSSRKVLPGGQADICSNDGRTLFVHRRGVTTLIDLSDIESPQLLGTIGEYFHDVTRRGDLVFAVLTGLKVYRLEADPSRE